MLLEDSDVPFSKYEQSLCIDISILNLKKDIDV